MTQADDRFQEVRAAELALLGGEVRSDPARVRELLHPDFVEIGRSGRRWTRDETIAALASEVARVTPDTDEWEFTELSPTLVLVTYCVSSASGQSRHSSLWEVGGAAPVIRFHQGTVVTHAQHVLDGVRDNPTSAPTV
ncbi:MAG: nuclear transport factor 2 family protein [Microbacterium sp.]|nr:nuclear transport factor 2 family protein [Microbacterium sp.]